MSDPIERQEVMDAIYKCTDIYVNNLPIMMYKAEIYKAILELPSARPEIIRCKDCKHYKAYEYTGQLACHYVVGGEVRRNPDDFCSRAERISDDKD